VHSTPILLVRTVLKKKTPGEEVLAILVILDFLSVRELTG